MCSDPNKTPKIDINNSMEIDKQKANEVECSDELPLCTKMLGILTLRQMQKVCSNNFYNINEYDNTKAWLPRKKHPSQGKVREQFYVSRKAGFHLYECNDSAKATSAGACVVGWNVDSPSAALGRMG